MIDEQAEDELEQAYADPIKHRRIKRLRQQAWRAVVILQDSGMQPDEGLSMRIETSTGIRTASGFRRARQIPRPNRQYTNPAELVFHFREERSQEYDRDTNGNQLANLPTTRLRRTNRSQNERSL
jgi:hypothetical protein